MSTSNPTTRRNRSRLRLRLTRPRIGNTSPTVSKLAKSIFRVRVRINLTERVISTAYYSNGAPQKVYKIDSGNTKGYLMNYDAGNKIFINKLGEADAQGNYNNLKAIIHKYGEQSFNVNEIIIKVDHNSNREYIKSQIEAIDNSLGDKVKFHHEAAIQQEIRTKESLGKLYDKFWRNEPNKRYEKVTGEYDKIIYDNLGKEKYHLYTEVKIPSSAFDDTRFIAQKHQVEYKRKKEDGSITDEWIREKNKSAFENGGAYFHVKNDNNDHPSTERIILNISDQAKALDLITFLADRYNTVAGANITKLKFLANDGSEGLFVKNDKMVIYLNNDENNDNRNAVVALINVFIAQRDDADQFLRPNLSAFYKMIQPGIGVGEEIAKTSFTIERSKQLADFINNKNAIDFGSRKDFMDDVFAHLEELNN